MKNSNRVHIEDTLKKVSDIVSSTGIGNIDPERYKALYGQMKDAGGDSDCLTPIGYKEAVKDKNW